MEPGQTAAEFQSTMWSLVLGAGADREHLERLLRLYWSPVYGFIRRQGYSGHDASDLTQEFMTRVVVGRGLLAKADPDRGRFRSFLKQSLRNFLIDQHRTGKHHKGRPGARGGATAARSPDNDWSAPDPEAVGGRLEEFDKQWAAAVVEATLQRLEELCRRDGMDAHWTAFGLNVLGPTVRKTTPLTMEELARRIGAVDASQASNMLQTVKRRFRRVLREVVADTVQDPAMVEDELNDLREHFGG